MKIEYYVEFGERYKSYRLCGIEKFECEIENFILNTFINFKPVKRFENRSGVSELRQLYVCCVLFACVACVAFGGNPALRTLRCAPTPRGAPSLSVLMQLLRSRIGTTYSQRRCAGTVLETRHCRQMPAFAELAVSSQ